MDVLAELANADVPIIVASQCYQSEVMLGHYETGNASRSWARSARMT